MMINTVESLRELYVALGGDLSDVANITTIPEMLSKISLVAQAAATELPVVSGADDGDVLGVVSGKWAKMSVPTELPAVTNVDDGNVLGVVSGNWAKMSVPTELPTVGGTDSGKVLTVSNSNWVAANLPSLESQINVDLGILSGGKITVSRTVANQVVSYKNYVVTFDDGEKFFHCSSITSNSLYNFVCVERGESSTIYHSFQINKLATGSQSVTVTSKTINDPV